MIRLAPVSGALQLRLWQENQDVELKRPHKLSTIRRTQLPCETVVDTFASTSYLPRLARTSNLLPQREPRASHFSALERRTYDKLGAKANSVLSLRRKVTSNREVSPRFVRELLGIKARGRPSPSQNGICSIIRVEFSDGRILVRALDLQSKRFYPR